MKKFFSRLFSRRNPVVVVPETPATLSGGDIYCTPQDAKRLVEAGIIEIAHADSETCWCAPRLVYVDPVNGNRVWSHQSREDAN